jgi:dTDP-4-dehydrorhamnose 3,5-epimerase
MLRFKETTLKGVWLIEPTIYGDDRGHFLETFREVYFKEKGLVSSFVQDNISVSKKGAVRGLHYQCNPHAQAKLVMAIEGEILDVAVDLRKSSSTFGKSFKAKLNSNNRIMMLIPEGFAHGFSVLSEKATVYYKCSNYYNRDAERGIKWDDLNIGIDWEVKNPILSEKDENNPNLADINPSDLF